MQKGIPVILLLFLGVLLPFTAFSQVIEDVQITGNKQTREILILDYLGFEPGDEIDPSELPREIEQGRERLMNTSLFLSVDIAYETTGDKYVLFVNVQERWYYWLYPILEHADRNFAAFLESGDWSRVNYGLSFEKHNFRGMDEFLKLKIRLGFKSQFGIMYDVPAVGKQHNHGFQVSVDRFRQQKLIVGVNNDKPLYYFDQEGSGLGEFRFRAGWHFRINHYQAVHFVTEYQDFHFSSGLDSVAPDYLNQELNELRMLSVKMKYVMDFRNDKYYPTDGIYASVSLDKHGLGLLGSPVDLMIVSAGFSWFYPLSERWSLSSESYMKAHLMNQSRIPFLYSVLLGYEYFPRGYEYYMVQSPAGAGSNETLRYRIFQSPEMNLGFIPVEAFRPFEFSIYAVAFTDVAFTWEEEKISSYNNTLPGALLFSAGMGLDFVTYYDRSLGFHFAMTNQKAFGIFAIFRSPLYKSI